MSSTQAEIVRHLPSLRRYARCLTGSQDRGDRYVRACLESTLADLSLIESLIEAGEDPRIGLYHVFHALWNRILAPFGADPLAASAAGENLERHIRALPAYERETLLLTTLCDFTLDDAARILGITHSEAEHHLARARKHLNQQTRTRVLVIEDEPVIAFDLASIVDSMGHGVIGIADTKDRAVEMARARRPGIVLVDIQLRDGSSGIDAVHDILEAMDVPVIFVTAFPERLLTGERREPTYLITKPFDPEELQVTISQALLMHPRAPAAAAG
jgi:CheY-like chemotaxis protein/DNA-directed RNA polymerase specialized sigma24 family protein